MMSGGWHAQQNTTRDLTDYTLIDGEMLVTMSPVRYLHGRIAASIGRYFCGNFVRGETQSGRSRQSRSGYHPPNDSRNLLLIPDGLRSDKRRRTQAIGTWIYARSCRTWRWRSFRRRNRWRRRAAKPKSICVTAPLWCGWLTQRKRAQKLGLLETKASRKARRSV